MILEGRPDAAWDAFSAILVLGAIYFICVALELWGKWRGKRSRSNRIVAQRLAEFRKCLPQVGTKEVNSQGPSCSSFPAMIPPSRRLLGF